MSVILIRSLILYILVIFAVRLMGKRQLGELQPSELVITILISNIATLPLEDVSIPLSVGITPILALVCIEVIVSWLNLMFPKLRKIISGSPKIIIRNGRIESDILRELRLSVDDLMTALRTNDIFDISEVQFAIVETTGSVSIMKKQPMDTPTRSDLNITCESSDPPVVIAADGKYIPKALEVLSLTEAEAGRVLKKLKMKISDVFIMTADSSGKYYVADYKGSQPKTVNGSKSNDKS